MVNVWTVLLGILAASAIFYIRSSMLLAIKQRTAAVRLEAYLNYWTTLVLDNDLFSVFYVGVKWNEEIREVIAKGGSLEDLANLTKEKKKIIEDIRKGIRESQIDIDAADIRQKLDKIPPEFMGSILDYAKQFRQNILEGKTFLSDDEAAALGRPLMSSILEMKMNIISVADSVIMIMLTFVNDPESFKLNEYENEIAQCVWKAVVISRLIDSLKKSASRVAETSVVTLTGRNMLMEL